MFAKMYAEGYNKDYKQMDSALRCLHLTSSLNIMIALIGQVSLIIILLCMFFLVGNRNHQGVTSETDAGGAGVNMEDIASGSGKHAHISLHSRL